MCEASENYFWDLTDRIGSGSTADVYKAYNIRTSEIAAAKVSRKYSVLSNVQATLTNNTIKKSDSPSIFQREIDFLSNIDHDNIVRFIGLEQVSSSDDPDAIDNQEVLFIEYCNGGSVSDMLQLHENRYGLCEDLVLQIIRDVTNALKYLHEKEIIHRDIKPDNIMQSVGIDGKVTFKLTDLGVARHINPNELTSESIRGTEEYIHPLLYEKVFPNTRQHTDRNTDNGRAQFPFEVELWSFSVTFYQCATGELPFQPFEGARTDTDKMREILCSLPSGCISGIQKTYKGDIEWSTTLPETCRLSSDLKSMLQKLLSRLFERNAKKLMKHNEFFNEVDKILSLKHIYYLNLKKCTLNCAYIPPNRSISKLIDRIRKENNDEDQNIDYYCLFQNIHYRIAKNEIVSMKTFCAYLPVLPSRNEPLVIYTFSSIQCDQIFVPKIEIPELKPERSRRDKYLSVSEQCKNLVGLFYYLRSQFIEYESIMKTTQSSVMTIHQLLKLKLFQFLCLIREKLPDLQTLNEFQGIITVIRSANKSLEKEVQQNEQSKTSKHTPKRSIIRSLSRKDANPQHKDLTTIIPIIRSSSMFYNKLREHENELSSIIEKYFNDVPDLYDNNGQSFHIANLSKRMHLYSTRMQEITKYVDEIEDFSERFQQDTKTRRPDSLQMAFHILRQKKLKAHFENYIHFINEQCHPLRLEIFNEFRKLTKLQSDINKQILHIRDTLENNDENNLDLDNCRQLIINELHKISKSHTSSSISLSSENSQQRCDIYQTQQQTNLRQGGTDGSFGFNQVDRTVINDIHSQFEETITQTENTSTLLNDVIRQLRP